MIVFFFFFFSEFFLFAGTRGTWIGVGVPAYGGKVFFFF